MTRRDLLTLLVVAALWGASYLFIAVALDAGMTPASVVTVRIVLGAVVALGAARPREVLTLVRRRPGLLVLLALLQFNLPLVLLGVAERSISSALAGTLVAATPLFVVAMAPLTGGARQSRGTWVGVLVGLVGVMLLLGLDPSAVGATGRAALVLVVALSYALGTVLAGRGFVGVPKRPLLGATLALSALLSVPATLVDPPRVLPGPTGTAALLALGLLGTGVAFLLFYGLLDTVGPERAILVTYLAPVFAVAYGVLLLAEDIGPGTVAGLLLVLVGARVAGRSGRRARAPVGSS